MLKPHIWKYGGKWYCGRQLLIGLKATPAPVAPLFGRADTPNAAYADWEKVVERLNERLSLRVEETKYRKELLTEDSARNCEMKLITAWRRYWPLVVAACLALVGLMALVLDAGWRL